MAVQRTVAEQWKAVTGCFIAEGYGLSETSPTLTCNPATTTDFSGSIGIPVPSTWISIRDDDGNEVPLGQPGEICAKGPQVMSGYWNRPEDTANVMTADGYFRTGDIGVMDERGYTKIVDRKKDMILVSGFNVYPNEIEEVIASHPGVLECAVIGIPDSSRGGGEGLRGQEGPEPHRGRSDQVLSRAAHRLQGAQAHRIPHRPAEDQCRQDLATAAPRREEGRGGVSAPWFMPELGDIKPADILAFWREAGRDRWYKRDDAFDADIRRRFLALWQKAAAGGLASWGGKR